MDYLAYADGFPVLIDSQAATVQMVASGRSTAIRSIAVAAGIIQASASGYEFQWVQLVTTDVLYKRENVFETFWQRYAPGGDIGLPLRLDTRYPYEGITAYVEDSPGSTLTSDSLRTERRADTFQMFFMAKPDSTDSIWIPVARVDWSWGLTACRGSEPLLLWQKSLTDVHPPPDHLIRDQVVKYPTWAGVLRGADVTSPPIDAVSTPNHIRVIQGELCP